MKRLLILCCALVALASPALGGGLLIGSGLVSSGCSPAYSSELLVESNATDDSGGNEANAVSGWTNSGCSTFESSSADPSTGIYHLSLTADTSNDFAYRNISSLTDGVLYEISLDAKHTGTGGDWIIAFNNSASTSTRVHYITPILTTDTGGYLTKSLFFIKNNRFDTIIAAENNATNNGSIYIDNMSIKTAELCYKSELNDNINASSVVNEVNSTTGWVSSGVDVLESTSSGTPNAGTYHIHAYEDGTPSSNCYIYYDLSTLSLVTGKKYLISLYIKHHGSGDDWRIGFSGTLGSYVSGRYIAPNNISSSNDSSYIKYGISIVYDSNYRYIMAGEDGPNNTGGIYIDSLSVKEIENE